MYASPQASLRACGLGDYDTPADGFWTTDSAAARGGAAGITLAAGAAAHQGELAALGAGVALVAFESGQANLVEGAGGGASAVGLAVTVAVALTMGFVVSMTFAVSVIVRVCGRSGRHEESGNRSDQQQCQKQSLLHFVPLRRPKTVDFLVNLESIFF